MNFLPSKKRVMPNPVLPAKLPIQPVDPNSPVPLYHQVEIDLQMLIRSGMLAPDDLLPPEVELSKLYGVGRQTIRMALSRLVAEKLIARRAGRGTMVLAEPDRKSFYLDRSFTHQMADLGMTASSRVLHAARGVVGTNAPKDLRDSHGRPCFYLVRLRYGGDQPIGLQYTTILTQRCADIDRFNFNAESLYGVLSSHYHLVIHSITHRISALSADESQADLLGVRPGDALLQVSCIAYLDDHEIIESSVSYYRTDKYEFTITEKP